MSNLVLEWVTRSREAFVKRLVILGDNIAVVAAFTKERSSSGALVELCRKTTAYELAADLYVYHCWIPTGINPADAPPPGAMRTIPNSVTPVQTRRGAAAQWAGAVKPTTRRLYAKAVEKLNNFIAENAATGGGFESYEDALCNYLSTIRRPGDGRQSGNLASAGLKHFAPGTHLPKSAKVLKSWAIKIPSKPWKCIPEAVVILLVATALRRGRINIAGWILTSFVCLPRISAASRILSQDLVPPGDPRFAGMGSGCYIFIGYDKRQKTPRLVDVYDTLCIDILKILTETQPANDWRLLRVSGPTIRRKLRDHCYELGWEKMHHGDKNANPG